MFFVRGHTKRVLKCVQRKHLQYFPNPLLRVTSLLWLFNNMEGLEGFHGAKVGSDPEFHEIPSQGSSYPSQAEYIRAPSQGLPTTTNATTDPTFESPSKLNQIHLPTLTILFKMLREDGRPLPVGSFTERSITRKVYSLTGVAVE